MGSMIPESIKELIVAKLAELGYEPFDIRFFQAGSRALVRITIDARNGVSVGDCEKVSNELSLLLDVEDFSAGRPYTLEVSSPGIDRPLKTERDFRRTAGRFVVLQMAPVFNGKKTLRGKVVNCTNVVVLCEIDGIITELPLSLIVSGKEELQFK